MRILISFILFFVSGKCLSQDKSAEIINPLNSYGLTYVHEATIPGTNGESINLSDISGSPYWNSNWQKAILFCTHNSIYTVQKVKLNLYDNNVHYLNEQEKEMTVSNIVNKIAFYNESDSSAPVAVFEKFSSLEGGENNVFYQNLNTGDARLLKRNLVKLEKRRDAIMNKNIYSFSQHSKYYLYFNNSITALDKIKKANILSIIPPNDNINNWLKDQKNDLKNEEQVVQFLNFYNEQPAR